MKRLFIAFILVFTFNTTSLMAEEFTARYATYEKDGKKVELKDISRIPAFQVDYRLEEGVINIKCSAGILILTKGEDSFGYRGTHKGLDVTATAHFDNEELVLIVYEEHDSKSNQTVVVEYSKERIVKQESL